MATGSPRVLVAGGISRTPEAAGAPIVVLGTERKRKTGDKAEDDERDDEIEKVRVLLFVFHRKSPCGRTFLIAEAIKHRVAGIG